jgi:hypothetical protein
VVVQVVSMMVAGRLEVDKGSVAVFTKKGLAD